MGTLGEKDGIHCRSVFGRDQAPSPSGKALDCKSGIRRFDSDRRLSNTEVR